ncbi:dioxygenase [Pontibacter diazotrophicus]|uniref:Dioxygenase n=1 Tax=Pontibacter diazotrophicus TaxID=1400979 RepID=A0A3D8LA81_9BACT|nr:VOC family protein [Pontibacter diazotrophicus]RDV14226.1 dioxygenase [Pontibacter diazotrophicus]
MSAFHYAFKVKDIASTRRFYVDIMGCAEGRSTERWIDFDFFGNQLSAHISTHIPALDYCGTVDGVSVPIPHFGCILEYEQFHEVQERLLKHNIEFIVKPQTRYEGQKGEQQTMFILDLSGNPIEFKTFRNKEEVFAS